MNYYIQGDAANAEEIKATFEKLGVASNADRYNYKNDNVLYFTAGGMIHMTDANGSWANIIKTHPGYKELELPVQPKFKFKVGDWIVQNDNGTVSQITKTINGKDEYGEYRAYEHTNGYFAACFEKEYHLWTIADAKDGDVLVTTKIRSCPFIYRKTNYNNNLAYYYAGIDGNGDFCEGCLKRTLYHFGSVSDVIPATKEQRNLLFKKMKEAGYQWDAEKKELKKIPKPHYDISNFKPFDKVLARDRNSEKWQCALFSNYDKELPYSFITTGADFKQCIPFEGNEHLLGTTDMCDEQYINW